MESKNSPKIEFDKKFEIYMQKYLGVQKMTKNDNSVILND